MPAESGELFINGHRVGRVQRKGQNASWGFGDFEPFPDFAKYAVLFGAWSMLLHEDVTQRVSRDLADELRRVERALDELRAELVWLHDGQRISLGQINIDGEMIEWKMA